MVWLLSRNLLWKAGIAFHRLSFNNLQLERREASYTWAGIWGLLRPVSSLRFIADTSADLVYSTYELHTELYSYRYTYVYTFGHVTIVLVWKNTKVNAMNMSASEKFHRNVRSLLFVVSFTEVTTKISNTFSIIATTPNAIRTLEILMCSWLHSLIHELFMLDIDGGVPIDGMSTDVCKTFHEYDIHFNFRGVVASANLLPLPPNYYAP